MMLTTDPGGNGPMRVLVSGVGRSGTTFIYRQLAKCMLLSYDSTQFRYEPYLWAMTCPKVQGSSFEMDQLSQYGMHVHQSTPLFLRQSHQLHDEFLDHLFAPPKNEPFCLVKAIRGNGRLESYLQRFPDLKIVACLRNPIETINSSLGMFSFLGDEFHASDGERLVKEVATDPLLEIEVDPSSRWTQLDYTMLWWRSQTLETLRLAKKYPDNISLFLHENFLSDPDSEIQSLCEFLPFADQEIFEIGLSDSAGPRIRHSNLLNADIANLYPHLQFYFDEVLKTRFDSQQVCELQEQILTQIAGVDYTEPLAGDKIGLKTSIQLRSKFVSGKTDVRRYTGASSDSEDRLPLNSIVTEYSHESRTCPTREQKYRPPRNGDASDKTFGCIITCHNDQNTILDSLVSALNQTRPFDKIIVVDDASSDNSVQILKDFTARYRTVEILELNYNVGVTAARHFGFLNLDTDFVTQLDGDDCFWPTKNFHEAKLLLEDPDCIAFSDILMLTSNNRTLVSTMDYERSREVVARQLLSRHGGVPRDMTFPRKLYTEINGYDLRVPLFEDLDFKIRLALKTKARWKRSDALVGTIYDRRLPSWSADVGFRLARYAIAHYFRFVDEIGLHGLEAAASFRELLRPTLDDWAEDLFNVLAQSTPESIQKIKQRVLDPRISSLSDEVFESTIKSLCESPSFNTVPAGWKRSYGVGHNAGPYAGYDSETLHWQTSRNCGFTINPSTEVAGVRGLLYIPHVPEQTLDVQVEQDGKVAKHSFVIDGGDKDETGNHLLKEVAIPISLTAGEAKISCTANSCIEQQDSQGELYCLFADWQVYY